MTDYVELELSPMAGTSELGLSDFRTMEGRLRTQLKELPDVEEEIGRVLVLVGYIPHAHLSHTTPTHLAPIA